ncbi:MAG: thiamine pyrophosphate-binding protein [Blautia sp.]|nr:thiamine pyrophosphate-binding protein [Blautia sp.]
MRVKVSNYIADWLTENGIHDVFTVTGGGAMHLNDAFGHHWALHCTYQHHEQACAMAAEGYTRLSNQMAAVCVTTGPGATNAITGILGGWMDSIPMMVFSGQARYETTVRASGLKLRSMGVQECDIVPVVTPLTKYAVMVTEPLEIRYHLDKALFLAKQGRPGPVWLDLPLDVQGAVIETEELKAYDPAEDYGQVPEPVSGEVIEKVLDLIEKSERPVLSPGNGVRLAGANVEFQALAQVLGVPVVTGMSSVDAIASDDPLFAGRSGTTGDRAGNFAVQNSDLFISVACRQGFTTTGFHYQSWARAAYTVFCDIDENELRKPNLHVDLPIVADARDFLRKLLYAAIERGATPEKPLFEKESWREQCQTWKKRYPVVTREHYKTLEEGCTNLYAFYAELSGCMKEKDILLVSVGTARVAGSQAFQVKKGQRFITNPNTAAMGFCLPAAIGISTAANKGEVVCVTGEGSLQMNLQELQTIYQNQLPVKVFVINNQGYHSIRQTQQNYFGEPLVGIGEESGDLSFPDLSKLSAAYGFPYECCRDSSQLPEVIQRVLDCPGAVICEVFVTRYQKTEPKVASRKLEDGRMVSTPLEDMAPFLSREELEENMYIPLLEESKQS